ncbi:MAG TPA: hypothetical protein VJ991_02690 [Balneolales bacterium]|nr:hypothetical protein [Balneolales bacterium]
MRSKSIISIAFVLCSFAVSMGQSLKNPNFKLYPPQQGSVMFKPSLIGLKINTPQSFFSGVQNMMSQIDASNDPDYVLSVPLDLKNINWQVSKINVYGVILDNEAIYLRGSTQVEVPSSRNIQKTVYVPVFKSKSAGNGKVSPTSYYIFLGMVNNNGDVAFAGDDAPRAVVVDNGSGMIKKHNGGNNLVIDNGSGMIKKHNDSNDLVVDNGSGMDKNPAERTTGIVFIPKWARVHAGNKNSMMNMKIKGRDIQVIGVGGKITD